MQQSDPFIAVARQARPQLDELLLTLAAQFRPVELNRADYEMTFNQALGSGNVLVSDKVRIDVEISAVRTS